VNDPATWLVAHGADLADQELFDVSELLKQMLVFEKNERICVAQVLKSNYIMNYHKTITNKDIRAFQRKVLNLDALKAKFSFNRKPHMDRHVSELIREVASKLPSNLHVEEPAYPLSPFLESLPTFMFFSWHCPFIQHQVQPNTQDLAPLIRDYKSFLKDELGLSHYDDP
jgi:hypothetical protein